MCFICMNDFNPLKLIYKRSTVMYKNNVSASEVLPVCFHILMFDM